jgi:uncharacterized membrane protein YdjX (TVP38/TMEM64 family)
VVSPFLLMRLLYIFFGLAVLFLIPFLIWGEHFEAVFSQQGSVAWLRGYGDHAWLAAVLLLILDLFLPIPATAVLAALGIIYGPLAGGAIGASGSVLSGILAYGLCRLLGRAAARRILGERDLQRGEQLFVRIGGWLVILSRWLPMLPEIIACMAGLLRMPAGLFALALICGSLPPAFTFAAVGHLGADRPWLTLLLSALLPLLLWLTLQPFLRITVTPSQQSE